ncbi:LicD family protein [Anaerocolumna xylanovorans]|uniref:Lipopolysaccharide cholinephosphotransferase n=1 Tax=Anaerocolumna xylanovorans DSM 12503 TaxID=1121345 RepID=A0A1M7Y811_9FIRM|nr:LicD family protein [Anaerocolumna xylanovorans]SHO48775.1 lipopolysaccharide cholinephosphotransferase [Anaerocolumna xylanovorans DSM 12503]
MQDIKANRMGYKISEDELRQIQVIQLELIIELDRICKKCGIKYNIVGGTMLGAARCGGYIPWDDDADIGFLRQEYEKFRKACKSELDKSRFYFQDYRNTKGYRWGYGKLRRKDTKFVRLYQEDMPYEQGIFIDIMPFDSIPDNILIRKIHFFECFLYRKAFWARIGKNQSVGLERLAYLILDKIPEKRLYKSYNRFISHWTGKEAKEVRILTFPTPRGKYGYDIRWYTELSEIEFEGLMLPCAVDYDGYLKYKYGNYMELPPIEKRKTHPVSELKLLDI